jgi:hypothetical protein
MDYIAHGFWSYIVFNRIKKPLYAVLFGLLPDTASWGIIFIYLVYIRLSTGILELDDFYPWMAWLYGLSHSLFVAIITILTVFITASITKKDLPLYMLAWPLHILIDIPTHEKDFFPTPFLWPVSDWTFSGISWGTSYFMIANYTLITLILFGIIYYKKGLSKKPKPAQVPSD